MDILNRIIQLRDDRGWSNYKLAKKANLPEGSLNNLFRLGNKPTFTTLEAICRALGISLSEFFMEDSRMLVVNEEELQLLKSWRRLDKEQKDAFLVLMGSR